MKLTQIQVETQLSDNLPHGMREDIARETGKYPSVVSGWFNPDDERKSPYFTVLLIQAAIDNLDPDIGDIIWNVMTSMREASRPARRKPQKHFNADEEMGRMSKEVSDVIHARCSGLPIAEQFREIKEAREQIDRYESAVKDELVERAAERSQPDRLRVM
jgi:hypothetical protein